MYLEVSALELTKLRMFDKYLEGHNGFIAGGCFKNLFKGQRIKDIDIFFKSVKDYENAIRYFNNKKVGESESYEYYKYYENDNCVAFKSHNNPIAIELIKNSYGACNEVLDVFDFTITKFAYYKKEERDGYVYTGIYHNKFFEHLMNNKLVLESSELLFPVSTFERSLRYTKYGYGLCKESKANLIESLQGANINELSNALYFGID